MNQAILKKFTLVVRIACFCLFMGRGWQHLFWDAPFRTLLWSQDFMQKIVENVFALSWSEYVQGGGIGDQLINLTTKGFGIFYIALAILCLYIKQEHKKLSPILILGSLFIFKLAFLYSMGRGFEIGMLIEHSVQFGVPLVLYILVFKPDKINSSLFYIKLIVSLTFIGHGLYAIGYYPIPGKFIDMIINVFGFSEDQAILMLRVAGIFDFSAGIFIFVPVLQIYALVFNIFWGFTTAFARTVAHFDLELFSMSVNQWLLESLYRFPHGLLPLALFIYLRQKKINF